MKVSELGDIEFNMPEYTVESLANVEMGLNQLEIAGSKVTLDKDGLNNLSQYLSIPKNFMSKIPSNLSSEVINHFLDKWSGSNAIFGTRDGVLTGVYPEGREVFYPQDYVGVIQAVAPPEAEIKSLILSGNKIEMNLVTESLQVEAKPGDITLGGLRVIAYVGPTKMKPYVTSYMERLICSNGMSAVEEGSSIRISGVNVPEVLAEMERYANELLSLTVPERLGQWKNQTSHTVRNPATMINALGRRFRVSPVVTSHMLDNLGEIEGNSLYDVINFMTSYQHEEGISHKTAKRLQLLGGEAVRTHDAQRCVVCDHVFE
jgi:hypothetical protein